MSSYEIADAKLGFELETAAIQFEFDEGNPVNPKGELVEFFGPDPATGRNGPLPQLSLLPLPNAREGSAVIETTAEIGSRLSSVRIEFIFGGKKGAFFGGKSQNMSLQAGNKIVEVMTKWVSFPQPNAITMKIGLNGSLPAPNAPPWRCRLPAGPSPQFPLGQSFLGQMTAAFPLAAIPSILLEEKKLVFTPSGVTRKFLEIKTDSIEDALDTSWGTQWRTDVWRSNISPHYGCNSLLGFLILVQSYVQVATPEASSGDNDLKLKTPIMPRTDFRTMLRIVTDLMNPESATAFATILLPVMRKLNTQLGTKNWFWNRSTGAELRLSVEQWLEGLCAQPGKDQIAINDKVARNEQIGGLKTKVERMIGMEGRDNAPLCPILEFRSLGSLTWTEVASEAQAMFKYPQNTVNYEAGTSILQTLEQWVRDHHSEALSSYNRASTATATTAKGPHTTTPAPGFIPQMASNAASFAFSQFMGGQSSSAASRGPAPPPPPTTRTSNPRPPPPPPPVSSQAAISRSPPPPAGQPSNAQATPKPSPPQAMPNSQGRNPPVVPARVPAPAKVPPPVPARR